MYRDYKNRNYVKKELTKEEKFENMIQKFLKDSTKKQYEISDEHTKSGRKKAKAENAKRRKIALNKKNSHKGDANNGK